MLERPDRFMRTTFAPNRVPADDLDFQNRLGT